MLVIPDRTYAQQRDRPKMQAWFAIVPDIGDEIHAAALQVINSYDIETNVGEQLNVIGRIVRADRGELASVPIPPGEEDDYFRLLLRARIAQNNGDGTIDSVLTSLDIILNRVSTGVVIDHEDMSFSVNFFEALSTLERTMLNSLDIVPKPQGVRFRGFAEVVDITEFGDDVDAQFGDSTAQFTGL